MKNVFLFLVTIFLFAGINTVNGQCTIDSTNCSGPFGAVCPDNLPDASVAFNYSEDVTFNMPSELDLASLGIPLPIPAIVITDVSLSISGLPDGLTATFSNANGEYDPSQNPYGCVNISGAVCDLAGDYDVSLNFDVALPPPVNAFLPSLELPFPISLEVISSFPDSEIVASSGFLCPSAPGDVVTLTVANGFDSYLWSTGETTNTVDVTSAGTYTVTLTSTGDIVCSVAEEIEIADLDASASNDTSVCEGEVLQLFASGGDSYAWSPTTGMVDANVANPVITGLTVPVTYQVIVSNAGCADTASVFVDVLTNCGDDCAGCVVSGAGCSGPVPTICTGSIADIEAGAAYDENITFFLPQELDIEEIISDAVGIPIGGFGLPIPDDLEVEFYAIGGVSGLPQGIEWECDQPGNDCTYFPGLAPGVTDLGCIKLCGNTCDDAGTYGVEFTMLVRINGLPDIIATLAGAAGIYDEDDDVLELPIEIGDVEVFYNNPLTVSPAGPITLNTGETVDLEATTTGLSGHTWSSGESGPSLTVSTAGSYTVTASDGACDQSATVVVNIVSSIADASIFSDLKLYPNPSTDMVTLEITAAEANELSVQVFDVVGKEMMITELTTNGGSVKTGIDVSTLSPGVYIVRISANGATVDQRISVY